MFIMKRNLILRIVFKILEIFGGMLKFCVKIFGIFLSSQGESCIVNQSVNILSLRDLALAESK